MTRKMITQVLAYLFVFWLGAKMVILTDKSDLTTYDWVSLAINTFITAYFVWHAQNESNTKQVF
jgi:hypothetical protein